MTATTERIAWIQADHYRESEEWQRSQAKGLADVLLEVIKVLGVEPDWQTAAKGEPVLFSTWTARAVIEAAKKARP